MNNAHIPGNNLLIKSSLTLDATELTALEQALLLTQGHLHNFANEPDFSQKMAVAFGEGAKVDSLRMAWSANDFSDFPEIEIRHTADINGANGAFAAATNKIYLSQEFIINHQGDVGAIARVLLEEFGHWVDTKINTTDPPGDEGSIFAAFVRGDGLNESQLHALKAENDLATVNLDGNLVEIEQAVSYLVIDIAARGQGDNFVNVLSGRNYNVLGSSQNNLILVNSGTDLVYGRGGDDTIGGGLNDDALYGGTENDIVAGNDGDDVIDGGGGKDTLAGGGGDDIYRISLDSNSAGTIINDWGNHQNPLGSVAGGGEDTLVIYQEGFQENPTEDGDYKPKENYQTVVQILDNRLQEGLIGSQRDGTALVIDLNKDGVINTAQDLSILNFYNEDGSPGIGHIENINFLSGLEVAISSNKDSIGIGSDHQAVYTFNIANLGTQDATEVKLEATIPKGINIIASSLPIISQITDSAGSTLLTLDAGSVAQANTSTETITIEATGFSQPLDKLLDYLWDINVKGIATANVLGASVSSNTASISTQVDSSKGLAEDLVKELLYGSQPNQNQAVARVETVERNTQANVNNTSDVSQPGLVNIGQDISNRFALKVGTRINKGFEAIAGITEQELINSGQFYDREIVENKISSFRLFGNVTNEFNLTYSQVGEDLKAAVSESIKEAGINFLGELGSKALAQGGFKALENSGNFLDGNFSVQNSYTSNDAITSSQISVGFGKRSLFPLDALRESVAGNPQPLENFFVDSFSKVNLDVSWKRTGIGYQYGFGIGLSSDIKQATDTFTIQAEADRKISSRYGDVSFGITPKITQQFGVNQTPLISQGIFNIKLDLPVPQSQRMQYFQLLEESNQTSNDLTRSKSSLLLDIADNTLRRESETTDFVPKELQGLTVETSTRVSVGTDGNEANNLSNSSILSGNGKFIVFNSTASNLVVGDSNGTEDVFIYNLQTNSLERISLGDEEAEANGESEVFAISADGRYTVFASNASNLVDDDTNDVRDIFIRDTQTASTRRISLAKDGLQANGVSNLAAISGDGRYVVFSSIASNLVQGDNNGAVDVFVRDLEIGTTELISVSSDRSQGNNDSLSPSASISADGRYVVFYSYATNLVSNDTNDVADIFLHDRQSGTTKRISFGINGSEANEVSLSPSISADGRYIVFSSLASNLVSGDTNETGDIFVYDSITETLERISLTSDGTELDSNSSQPSISADGRYVVFQSRASNLAIDNPNFYNNIYLRDRLTGETRSVSLSTNGLVDGNSINPSISANGSSITFESLATSLVAGDTNNVSDVFVYNNPLSNTPPILSNGVIDQIIKEDVAFSFTIPANTFTDIDDGDSLIYSVSLENGDLLPSWLTFDASILNFSGTPTNQNVGSLNIKVIATDQTGDSASDIFMLTVENVNDAPILENAIFDQTTLKDTTFTFTVPGNTFTDIDTGDSLTYSTTLDNGNPLPGWLTFDSATQTFAGTPGNENIGSLNVKVIATDNSGAIASNIFTLTVANTLAPILLQTTAGDGNLQVTVDSYGAFGTNQTGGQGGVYDPLGAGTPASTVYQSYLAARIGSSGSRTRLTNNALSSTGFTQSDTTSAQSSFMFQGLNFTLRQVISDTFRNNDRSGSLLTQIYTITNPTDATISLELIRYLDGDLEFDNSLVDGGGRLPVGINGLETLFETDQSGNAETDSTFVSITAEGGNIMLPGRYEIDSYSDLQSRIDAGSALDDAITGDSSPVDQFVDSGAGYDITLALRNLFELAPGASTTYTTLTQYGSGGAITVIPQLFSIAATDANKAEGNSGFVAFTFTITRSGDLSSTTTLDYAVTGSGSNPADAADFGGVLPSGVVTFAPNETSKLVAINVNSDTVVESTKDFTVTLSNPSNTASITTATATGTVLNDDASLVNTAPVIVNAIDAQIAKEDTAFSFTFDANTFIDVDAGDILSYSATLQDDSNLPSWLKFNTATRTFSGTPTNSNVGNLNIKLTATDTSNKTAIANFALQVDNVNDAPTLQNEIADQITKEDTAFSFTFDANTFIDVDTNDSLTYSATLKDGSNLPSWLKFNADTRTFSGTPTNADEGNLTIEVRAKDNSGVSTIDTFALAVEHNNGLPTFNLAKIADDIFKISNSSGKSKLKITLTETSSDLVNELGVFTVDDAIGNINGIAPGAAGYTQAALERSQVIFSAIANIPNGFNTDNLTHILEFNSSDRLRFYLVKNSTTNAVKAGITPLTDIVFSDPLKQKITDLGAEQFALAWKDGSNSSAEFKDMVVKIQATNDLLPLGTNLQSKPQGAMIDLRAVTTEVKADFVVNREAAFDNCIGFYQVADENGGIDTSGDGKADIFAGQAGYIQAAIRNRVAGIDLTVNNQGTATYTGTFQPGSIFAPFIIANGRPETLLDNNPNNDPAVYFPFLGANADKVDHIRLLGNNVFGFEDLPSAGDKDFNDVVVRVNLSIT
jgi:uncharacterized repeat protein (TIGR01451 family)